MIKYLLHFFRKRDPNYLNNFIGRPQKRPGKLGMKVLQDVAVRLEDLQGKQLHLVPCLPFDGSSRVMIIDKFWRDLYNKHNPKKKKFTIFDVCRIAIFSTSGKRKVL